MAKAGNELEVPALEVRQGPNRVLYQFAIDGKRLDSIASVTRIRRDDGHRIQGYQRPESMNHIRSIQRYIESRDPLIPNAIVIAFDSRVRFTPDKKKGAVPYVRSGTLSIPLVDERAGEEPVGWIVDGQQRSAAIRDAAVEGFPIAASAFITDNAEEQREQFILVNSTKPLPKSLIYELLPSTEAVLPPALAKRKLSAELVDRLNFDPSSPFYLRIKTATNPDGEIKDNSVLRMLDNSITDGCLYRFRDPGTGRGRVEDMALLVSSYWHAVASVFPTEWSATPRRSRLVHGVGIVAMGYLMDVAADHLDWVESIPPSKAFEKQLRLVAPVCRWSSGEWDFGAGYARRWVDLQNTSRDIQLLSNYLIAEYRRVLRASRASGTP